MNPEEFEAIVAKAALALNVLRNPFISNREELAKTYLEEAMRLAKPHLSEDLRES